MSKDLKYTVKRREFRSFMELMCRVFDIRIVFFDMDQQELAEFDVKEMPNYCSARRDEPGFFEKCDECDRKNLLKAKTLRDVLVYRCHAGLLEAIVPLYDKRSNYLGALFFGQSRETGAFPPADLTPSKKKLYDELAEYTLERLRDIASLIKHVSEYVINHELIKYEGKQWVENLEKYIDSNLSEKLTLASLAKEIGRSVTFVSHHFIEEFGESPKQYIRRKRLEKAMDMLKNGESVYNTARELGFYDEFHFSKSFKSFWGHPPKNFKAN